MDHAVSLMDGEKRTSGRTLIVIIRESAPTDIDIGRFYTPQLVSAEIPRVPPQEAAQKPHFHMARKYLILRV
jgi:hypothetical protein